MKTEIELNFSRQDFEEIYFKDFNGDYFRSPATKTAFRSLVISVVVFPALCIYAAINHAYSWLTFGCIALAFVIFNYVKALLALLKWKNHVADFLKREEKYNRNTLTLSDDYLSIVQDGTETIERWGSFSSVKITDDYVVLEGKENFIFPKKSMTPEDYVTFRKIVSEKVK